MKNILFIGLGVMGNPMAANIVACGRYRVCVHDVDASRAGNLVDMGAFAADDLDLAISEADLVLTSLPGPVQVDSVAFGNPGLFSNLRPGSAWIELSTNNLEVCTRLVKAASANQIDFLDAPVSGGDEGARAGSLTVLVGGDRMVYERLLPVLDIIGSEVSLLGPNGAGYSAKIAQVVLCYVHSLALSEALMLGVRGGVDVDKMLSIIQKSTGRSYVADRYGPCMLDGDYDPSFTVGLALKDMNLAMEAARNCGISLPLCELTTDTYRDAVNKLGFNANHLKAVQLLEQRNEVFLRRSK